MSQKKRPRGDPNFCLEEKFNREAEPGTWHACAKCSHVRHIPAGAAMKARLICYACKRQATVGAWRSAPELSPLDAKRVNGLVKAADAQNKAAHELLHTSKRFFHWVEAEKILGQLEDILWHEFPEVGIERRATKEGTHGSTWFEVHGTKRQVVVQDFKVQSNTILMS